MLGQRRKTPEPRDGRPSFDTTRAVRRAVDCAQYCEYHFAITIVMMHIVKGRTDCQPTFQDSACSILSAPEADVDRARTDDGAGSTVVLSLE